MFLQTKTQSFTRKGCKMSTFYVSDHNGSYIFRALKDLARSDVAANKMSLISRDIEEHNLMTTKGLLG